MTISPTDSAGDGGPKPGPQGKSLEKSGASSKTRRSKLVIDPVILCVKVYDHNIRCEDYFSPDLEKDLEKHTSKVEILHSQAKIDQAMKDIERKRVILDEMEKKVEPLRLELTAAAEASNKAKAAYDSKLLNIGEIESSIITNGIGNMSVSEKLKARKAELEISRLKAELLQIEIGALESEMLLESKQLTAAAQIKEFENARTSLGREEFALCDMKAAYKTLVAKWDAKYYDEEEGTFNHAEPEQGLSTLAVALTDAELKTKELEFSLAAASETKMQFQEKAAADAEQIIVLSKEIETRKAAELNIKEKADAAAKQVDILSNELETSKVSQLAIKKENLSSHKKITELEEKLHWQNSVAEYAQNNLKAQFQFQAKQIEILKAAAGKGFNPSDNEESEMKKVIDAQAREIEALKAVAVVRNATGLSKNTEAELKTKIDTQTQELAMLKKIIATNATTNNATTTKEGSETKIELMTAGEFQTLLDSKIKDIEALSQENVKVSREVGILNHQIAIMQPLYLLGRRVRVRHNIQQLRSKFGGQVSINVDTLEDGFVAVNGGRAIADSTIYIAGMYKPVKGEQYQRDHRDFEDLYGATASAAWEHRDFTIFINILDMLVDMKMYVRGNTEEKRQKFQVLADNILPRLYPKFEIGSDEEFAKHPDLVEMYKTMCKEHKQVTYADWQHRRKHAEKTWFEPVWMVSHYDFDNTAKEAGAF